MAKASITQSLLSVL